MNLYHGSKEKTRHLIPHVATGVGAENDRRNAVYASANRDFALLFCIPLLPDASGNIQWHTIERNGCIQMHLMCGTVDWTKQGYLYTVPAEDFTQLDELQWIATSMVTPLHCEKINPYDLQHLLYQEPHND